MSSVLVDKGHRDAASWQVSRPEFYVETAISVGGREESFILPVRQLERVSILVHSS
jgi:hypothetical protein